MKKDSGTNLNIFEDNLKRGAGSIGGGFTKNFKYLKWRVSRSPYYVRL